MIYTSPSWITALSWQRGLHNSMKLWAIPCRVTQDGQVIVKSSDTTWSTGGGNGNPLQYSSHENFIFPVVIYGCKSWTIKKAEHQGINAFELLCWRRLLRVPGTAKRSSQSILKENSSEDSLKRLMLELKLQCFVHLIQRVNSMEKTLMLGKIEGKSRKGQQSMRWLDSITYSMDMNLSKLRDIWRTGPGLVRCSP